MSRLKTFLFCAVVTILAACSGDESRGNNAEVEADAGSMSDASGDASTAADMSVDEDSGVVCESEPQCGEDEKQIGCRCVAEKDRSCVSDADCRSGEECRDVDGRMICWWEPPPVRVCPGSVGCDEGGDGTLRAAGVSKIVTPDGFETPLPGGLDESGAYLNFNPGADLEGRWRDCGFDNICPGEPGYAGPDEGEGDGELQAIWIAGFTNGRPAQLCPEERIGCDGPDCCVSKWAHDDIRVQIAVVEKDDVTIAFAALDTVGFFHTDIEAIREEVQAEVDVDLVVMAATHNHEGPDTAGQWGPGLGLPSAGRSPWFLDKVRSQTVAGIKEALDALEPADVEVAIVDEGIAGLAMSDSRTPYIYDDNIPVVRLRAQDDGETLATVLSVANHAEVLWSGNTLLTSDYFHFARKYIEEGLPAVGEGGSAKPALPGFGGVTVMFAGAVGGLINPGSGGAFDYEGNVPDEDHSWIAADAVGQRIAEHVLGWSVDGRFESLTDPDLRFATKRFLTGIENVVFQLAAWNLGILDRDIYNTVGQPFAFQPGAPQVQSQVAVVRLGPITFFTAPGEVFPESLVGGFPGGPQAQDPTVGDVEERRVAATCDADGLPTANDDGTNACIVKKDQENPPDWSAAPETPIYSTIPGEYPVFIGLGMDFLGYMVPNYDYEEAGYLSAAPGDHYEETNGAGTNTINDWMEALQTSIDALEE